MSGDRRRIPEFYKLSVEERVRVVHERGLINTADFDRLEAFRKSVADRGFRVIKVSLADHGLQVAQGAAGWQR